MSADTAAGLYGIGIGPGDSELITLKAYRLMNEADVIFTPKARIKGSSLARNIAEGAGISNRNFVEVEFPMVTDSAALEEKWRLAASTVAEMLEGGRTGVFITLGDPGIYSTWTYLQTALRRSAPDIRTETVAGISTMNAAAAALNRPLLTGREKLALIPLPDDLNELRPLLKIFDTIVVYKVSNRLHEFCRLLDELGLSGTTALVKRAGMEDEEIFRNLGEIGEAVDGYLSTAVIRCREEES